MRRPVLWCVLSFLLGLGMAWYLLVRRPARQVSPPVVWLPLRPAPERPEQPEPAESAAAADGDSDGAAPGVRIPAQAREEDEVTRVSGTLDDAFTADAAPAGPGGLAPSNEYTVKGAQGVFHTTESPDYPLVTATVWFRTVPDAERAGFVPWDHKTRPTPG
ncbi:hypothetical protein [Actinokineospora enzanensis]|uniref:sunset domain-containing protein n=1 Tax=Actinokineospora enzanensis TaxID=155975 RepID=UPI00039D61F7|nr:hypothetical protein [Actinokineospora enzanensis]